MILFRSDHSHDADDHGWVVDNSLHAHDDNVSWLKHNLLMKESCRCLRHTSKSSYLWIWIRALLSCSFAQDISNVIGVIRAGCSNKWTKWALRGLWQINTNHLLFLNEMQRYKASVNKHHLCSGAERHVVIALLESEVCVLPRLIVQVTIWTGFWKCNIALVK